MKSATTFVFFASVLLLFTILSLTTGDILHSIYAQISTPGTTPDMPSIATGHLKHNPSVNLAFDNPNNPVSICHVCQ